MVRSPYQRRLGASIRLRDHKNRFSSDLLWLPEWQHTARIFAPTSALQQQRRIMKHGDVGVRTSLGGHHKFRHTFKIETSLSWRPIRMGWTVQKRPERFILFDRTVRELDILIISCTDINVIRIRGFGFLKSGRWIFLFFYFFHCF